MPAPFYNAIKGTTGSAPGTGAFTPNAAASGGPYRPWSAVPVGWTGVVLYEDGTDWERQYSYWNGVTLSRGTNQFAESSTGSPLNLGASATATQIMDAGEIMWHPGGVPWRAVIPTTQGSNTLIGFLNTTTGTLTGSTSANTNHFTEQPKNSWQTLATGTNSAAGHMSGFPYVFYSTSAGRGGFEFVGRFGVFAFTSANTRAIIGLTTATAFLSFSGQPTSLALSYAAFIFETGDTNLSFYTKDGTTGAKLDTGIPLVANAMYEMSIWAEPGGGAIHALLIRLDTGAIWYKKVTTNLPANNTQFCTVMMVQNAVAGTASNMAFGGYTLRGGG